VKNPSHLLHCQLFWWYAGLMVLVFPVGIPSMYACLLFAYRGMLGDVEAMELEETNDFPITGHLKFLIEAYKVRRPVFFCELVVETSGFTAKNTFH
jgi:hypothetical protein